MCGKKWTPTITSLSEEFREAFTEKSRSWVPELKRYYVAVSEHQDVVRGIQGGKIEEPYIEIYEVEP
jgi:hypothetical protein